MTTVMCTEDENSGMHGGERANTPGSSGNSNCSDDSSATGFFSTGVLVQLKRHAQVYALGSVRNAKRDAVC